MIICPRIASIPHGSSWLEAELVCSTKKPHPAQARQLSMRVGMRTMYQLQAQLDKQEMAQPWVTKEAVRVPFGNGVDENNYEKSFKTTQINFEGSESSS